MLTRFRPPNRLTLEIHDQYKRNPARCQFTTLRGVTKTSGFLHPDQNDLNATQNSLCRAVNRRRGCCACRASNCRRRARFSRTRSSRERKVPTNQPRKCRSDTIMARIVSGKSESSFSQVIHSAGVRRFGEAQACWHLDLRTAPDLMRRMSLVGRRLQIAFQDGVDERNGQRRFSAVFLGSLSASVVQRSSALLERFDDAPCTFGRHP